VSYRNTFAIGIKQEFLSIETLSNCWVEWTICSIAIQLSSLDSWQKNMPVVGGTIAYWIERYGAGGNVIVCVVEQDQLHTAGACGEDAEVCSVRTHGCS
jgi:hypothetical protein